MGRTISAEQLNYLVSPFYLSNFKLERPKFYVIDQIPIYFPLFSNFFNKFLSCLIPWGNQFRKCLNYLFFKIYLIIQKFEKAKLSSSAQTSMYFRWFSKAFLNFFKFPQVIERGTNIYGGINSATQLKYLVSPSVFYV